MDSGEYTPYRYDLEVLLSDGESLEIMEVNEEFKVM